jgi:two-component system, sensor histidine kinase
MRLEDATSIRQKLYLILLRASLLSLLLAGSGLMAYDLTRHASAFQRDLETQADVLALTSQAALSFQDPQTAAEDLSSLRAKPSVDAAAIYDNRGQLFAWYVPPGSHAPVPKEVPHFGAHTGWRATAVVRPIRAKQNQLGFIYIRGQHQLLWRLLEYLAAFGVILVMSLGAALALTNRLQRSITGPITAISEVARKVLRGETHAVRAEKQSNDEVGELVEAFNAMLGELGRRADRLQESNRAKDHFLATLAHELRNPLAPIRTGLEILKVDGGRTGASDRARAMMERQLVHMVHLIDDLLDIARVNTGKFKLDLRSVGLRSLLDAAVEACRPGLQENRQSLAMDMPTGDVQLRVDPVRITQAVSNLLSNACKYTPPGGRIELRVTRTDGHVRIAVGDNGVGIAPASLDRVFELFAQVGGDLAGRQGLGIGLFLVRNVVEMHGGTVTAESAGEGLGSCFTIALPASVAEPPARVEPGLQAASPVPGGAGRRFLFVYDNVDAASTLAMLLEMMGHTVSVANSGEAALAAVQAFEPDIVVLDIGMPGMDGYEVARRLQRRTDLRRRPVLVAATGWGTEADRERAMAAGFDRHLTKPIEVQALEAIAASVA